MTKPKPRLPRGRLSQGLTVAAFGLPRWDVIWARHGSQAIGIELAGDAIRRNAQETSAQIDSQG